MPSGPCGASLRCVNGPDRVLVAYGTKHGATAEIAQVIADTLRAAGLQVDVQRARRVRVHSLEPYRAVVLGSAVYSGRWRRDAVRLLRRPQLKAREVWLFSSGPVGKAGDPEQLEKWTDPPRVREIAESIGVREHVVFGGMVAEDAGFIRRRWPATSRLSSATAASGTRSKHGPSRSRPRSRVNQHRRAGRPGLKAMVQQRYGSSDWLELRDVADPLVWGADVPAGF